jgi:hypothetical protein
MTSGEKSEQWLQCLVHIIGRAVIPAEKVYEIVGTGKKQIKAFNMCDGSMSQTEVSKKTAINQGNLSRTFNKWVDNGIAFWIGEESNARLLHIYPLPVTKKNKPKKNR